MLPIKLYIDDSFFRTEKRNDFLIDENKKRVWAVLLDLLNEFSTVCRQNDIQWFADAGTILGAARHQGFIPWDDDIDVMLTRENYEKLSKIAPTAFKYPYFFQTELTDPGSLRFHAQLRNSDTTGILDAEKNERFSFNQGIFIDIFPIDNLPDNLVERKRFLNKLERIKRRIFFVSLITTRYNKEQKRDFKGFARKILHFFYGNSPKKELRLYKKYETLAKKYCESTTQQISKLFQLPLSERRIWKTDWLKKTTFLQFEMLKIPVPSCYETILDVFYGDWMVCKKGTSTHGGVIFDTDNKYSEYFSHHTNVLKNE